jgi:hypothetical protein
MLNLSDGSSWWTIARSWLISWIWVIEQWRQSFGESYEFTKFQAEDVHLGHDSLYFQVVILHMQHSVDKSIERPCIGKISHYQHCFPHIVKPNQINHYVKDEQITTTKDGVKSFDNVIYDHFTPVQLVLYIKSSGHHS